MIKIGVTISVLDDFLKLMYEKKVQTIGDIMINLKANKILLHDFEVETIIAKLIEEKYVMRFDSGQYTLTVTGRMFFEKGGFRQQLIDEKRKARVEVVYIWAVGVGTVLAGIYGLFEMLKWLFHHEAWKLFF